MTALCVEMPVDCAPSEQRYLEALARLLSGQPKDDRIKVLLSRGELVITLETVAWEAGYNSRVPITGPKARWPRVRDEVLRVQASIKAGRQLSGDDEKAGLRTEIMALKALLADEKAKLAQCRADLQRALAQQAGAFLLLEQAAARSSPTARTSAERVAARRAAEARLILN